MNSPFTRRTWAILLIGIVAAFISGAAFAVAVKHAGGWDNGTHWDIVILRRSHQELPRALDLVLLAVPWFGTNITIFAVFIPLGAWLWRRNRRDLVFQLGAVSVGNYVLNLGLKFPFARPRPSLWPHRGEYSFSAYPSGHLIAMMSVAPIVAWLLYRERGMRWPFALWPVLVDVAGVSTLMSTSEAQTMTGATRRDFLRLTAAAGAGLLAAGCSTDRQSGGRSPVATDTASKSAGRAPPADVTIRIAPLLVELAPDHIISTVGYNGSVPAPVLRLREGKAVSVQLINDTDTPELVHWHGQLIPSDIDGASEEGTPFVPPHGSRRYTLTPKPAGTRWIHTHAFSGSDTQRGTYTGQFGIVYVEPMTESGGYDQEVFLATHEWEPFFGAEEMGTDAEVWPQGPVPKPPPDPTPNGYEIGYKSFSINGKSLGHGEPVHVKRGQRVMFRILNASATENIQLALPGHQFEVVAFDGNPVPTPRKVRVLALGVAERIDAIVEMNSPGVWILGTPHDDDRRDGMGIVIEYAGAAGAPRWIAPRAEAWDYTQFGDAITGRRGSVAPDETIQMKLGKINGGKHGFNHWTINGQLFEHSTPIQIHRGRRYRLSFENLADDPHPVHLHRHTFELASVNGRATAGVLKDTIVVPGYGTMDVDFVADNPGPTLFHCHQTLHMDFGFMRLFEYV